MASYPLITRRCPLEAAAQPTDGGACRHCAKTVHRIDRLSASARARVLSSDRELCVAYRVSGRLAVTLTLAALPIAAAAEPGEPGEPLSADVERLRSHLQVAATPADTECEEVPYEFIMIGGVELGADALWVNVADDALPELPLVDAESLDSP